MHQAGMLWCLSAAATSPVSIQGVWEEGGCAIPQLMLTLCLCARSTAAESTLEGSSWQVPDKPAVAAGAVTTHLHLWIAITLELH